MSTSPLPAHPAQAATDLDRERRSSSLSDLEENADNEEIDHMDLVKDDDSEANDTEAETERLEDSPLTQRKHQDVLLTSAGGADVESPLSVTMIREPVRAPSESSSSAVLSEEDAHLESNLSSPRKRKRSSFDGATDSLQGSPTNGRSGKSPSGSASPSPVSKAPRSMLARESPAGEEDEYEIDTARQDLNGIQKPSVQQRKSKRILVDEDKTQRVGDGGQDHDEGAGDESVLYSNGEEQEGEEPGDADPDNTGRSAEDVLKKKAALDALINIEKSFATMRDKLFDERLAAANEELALLQAPDTPHPELLAMKEVVDHHRNAKIEYQQTFLKYKLQTLQKESVANKHQILSQYMQTVREVRDKSLEQVNEEFYRVQRERRSGDGDVPDYLYLYNNKRSQQITQQTAYNSEVSILSGVAKYVGFPTAPAIQKARTDEVEDDLRGMGVSFNQPQMLPNRLPSAPLARAPTAEDHFFERNAWANPQHPVHRQRLQMRRQTSQLSQASTPVATPVPKGIVLDGMKVQGSASTIPDQPSGPGTSREPISIIEGTSRAQQPALGKKLDDPTPSKLLGSKAGKHVPDAENPSSPPHPQDLARSPRPPSPANTQLPQNSDGHASSALPRPLPFTQTPVARASPPVRIPVKVEDVGPTSRQSPAPHHFSSPAPILAAGEANFR